MIPWPLLLTMLAAGLAGSLHCIGMCGPLLVGFGAVQERSTGSSLATAGGFLWYHAGRIWTYGMLGFGAGAVGRSASRLGALSGWQRPVAVLLAALVIASGVALFRMARVRASAAGAGSCPTWLARLGWLSRLTRTPGPVARLLLGAVMGLLPCGLVYAMLVLAAGMGGPLAGSLCMLAFGLGTVPALTAFLLVADLLPLRLRARGGRVAALLVLCAGLWMLGRALLVVPGPDGNCPLCTSEAESRTPAGGAGRG